MKYIDDFGFTINGLHHISGKDFLAQPEKKVILLDVRPFYELGRLFDVDNILYCPYKEIDNQIDQIPTDREVVIADAVGLRSKEVAVKLLNKGLKNIHNLAGGIVDWEKEGLPVTTDKSRIMTGSCMCQLKVRS